MAKSCKKGYYYCNTDKKCKKIPRGFHVMPTGYLMRDSEHKDENKDETEGKKKNGNGNGSNGNGNGNGGSNGGSNGGGVSESKDHEVAMAQSQLKKSARNIEKLRKALGKKEKDIPAWMQAKITDTAHDTDAAAGYADKMNEGTLHKWFSGSKSKDGKGGWVNVTTGGTCASDEPGEGVPKCVSRSKYESMTPAERKSASRRKKSKDRGQQSKRNAAKPTYVATDKPKRKTMKASYSNWRADLEQLTERDAWGTGPMDRIKCADGVCRTPAEIEKLRLEKLKGKVVDKAHYEPEGDMVEEGKDRKGKGSGTKDACYHKVKSRYSVWPSAYASGALVKCRKVGAKNWGNKTKKEGFSDWREDMLLEGLEDKLSKMSPEQIEDLIKANKGAEKKIRDTLAKLKTATPNPQGKGVQLPNVPKSKPPTQPASTSSASYRETYRKGGSDRISYQRKPRPSAPKVRVKSPKVRVKPRMRGGKLGLAIGAATLAAPYIVGAIKKAFNKEDYEFSNWRDDFQATEYESVDIIKTEPLQPTQGLGSNMLDEKKRLMNKLDKISGQLRKASAMHKKQSQEVAKVSQHLCAGSVKHEEFGMGQCIFGQHAEPDENGFVSHYDVQFEHGIVENVSVEDMEVLTITEHDHYEMDGDLISEGGKKCWKGYKKAGTQKLFGKTYNRCVKAHFSDWRAEMDLQEAIPGYEKYNAAVKAANKLTGRAKIDALKAAAALRPRTEKEVSEPLGEDWQKSNRNDGVDGMSQKSVDAYKRENPGSKLKTAVTGKVKKGSKDAKRRKSFCSRSDGQRKMHNIDCKKTPDKKICKARRRWKC